VLGLPEDMIAAFPEKKDVQIRYKPSGTKRDQRSGSKKFELHRLVSRHRSRSDRLGHDRNSAVRLFSRILGIMMN
jgi:hypothetical protein